MKSKTEFPDYKKLSVADLVPYARNSRTHSPQQVDKIAASIREFGFLNPIIVDGRNARLMELDPKYCDVIVKRWQDFTGQEATLEESGETFNALAAKRIAA